jgi:hypothetical protein
MRLVRVAGDRVLLGTNALGGAVAALVALGSLAVQLHELGIVDIDAERFIDCDEV